MHSYTRIREIGTRMHIRKRKVGLEVSGARPDADQSGWWRRVH
jgi:hypothetical protein